MLTYYFTFYDISLPRWCLILFLLEKTEWIDVCPNNGNLLALSGQYMNIKIFDKRSSKVTKIFDNFEYGKILLFV